MNSIESTGKTVKDAIERGAQQLGVNRDDLDIQVLEMGSSGLFGLFGKPAKVRLTVRDKSTNDIEMPVFSLDQTPKKKESKPKQPKAPKAPKEEKPAETQSEEAPEEKNDEAEQPSNEEAAPRKNRRRRKPKQPREQRSENTETASEPIDVSPVFEAEPFVETPAEELSANAIKARDFLAGLTERMGVPCTLAVGEKEGQIRIVMSGENMSILIGRRGDTLDGLQYLTSLVVNRDHDDYIRVTLDTENYRAKREEALRKLAVRMANRCKKSGRRVALEPMNPYERRILHSALQNDAEVTTHSEGEEPYRRVIITLK